MKPCCLSQEQLNSLKKEIEILQEQLASDLELEKQDQQNQQSRLGPTEVLDRGEEASVVELQFNNISHITQLTEELQECKNALARIAAGTYGCCEGCREEIELNRLMANPVALLCISCQSREENQRQVASF